MQSKIAWRAALIRLWRLNERFQQCSSVYGIIRKENIGLNCLQMAFHLERFHTKQRTTISPVLLYPFLDPLMEKSYLVKVYIVKVYQNEYL